MRNIVILLTLGFWVTAVPGCRIWSKRPDTSADVRQRYGLIVDGGFEQGEGWYRSAPPGYSQYAAITRDRAMPHSGKLSAHVELRRHPTGAGDILHGYAQRITPVPAGRWLRFGGWVRLIGSPTLRFGIEYEVATPKDGRTFFTAELPPPPSDGEYHYLEQNVLLPPDVRNLIFYVGISTLGQAWFDDVFLHVME